MIPLSMPLLLSLPLLSLPPLARAALGSVWVGEEEEPLPLVLLVLEVA